MTQEILHPHVAFAKRYSDPSIDLLNAATAIGRLESLLEDVVDLKSTLDEKFPPHDRWYPWFGAEVISYYAVGYVTCLEWHARSRVVDLFTYKPSCLEQKDLKGHVTEKAIAQAVAQGATVARLLGASTSVSSLTKYMDVMVRVFNEVGIKHNPYDVVMSVQEEGGLSPISEFEALFAFRNELVHEISLQVVGHPNVRDSWSPEQAVATGQLVLRAVRAIESILSAEAPRDFPNLLDANGSPVWAVDRVSNEIDRLEKAIESAIQAALGSEDFHAGEQVLEDWRQSVVKAADSRMSQELFVNQSGFFHSRYTDLQTALLVEIASSRLRYLQVVLSEIEGMWGAGDGEEGGAG